MEKKWQFCELLQQLIFIYFGLLSRKSKDRNRSKTHLQIRTFFKDSFFEVSELKRERSGCYFLAQVTLTLSLTLKSLKCCPKTLLISKNIHINHKLFVSTLNASRISEKSIKCSINQLEDFSIKRPYI
jgi:hypothetical protein